GDLLRAYTPSHLYDERELRMFAKNQKLSFSVAEVENRHWNQLWESTFEPVIIDHPKYNTPWVGIRADFHEPITNVEHEIVITPRMSFGTGQVLVSCQSWLKKCVHRELLPLIAIFKVLKTRQTILSPTIANK